MKKSIQQRKKDHVELCLGDEVAYDISGRFNDFLLRHNALPELDLNEINTSVEFLGRYFSAPIFISSMTGGFAGSEHINATIAKVCEKLNLPFGVGSQRSMLLNSEEEISFRVARENAPTAFIAANIGGVQLISDFGISEIERAIDVIEANAIIIHLNPLQELVQIGGDRNFRGILPAISNLVRQLGIPVIVKETGAGISGAVAQRLFDAGVACIDVAGAGGTSWSKVERFRNETDKLEIFDNWGIPTALCIQEVSKIKPEDGFLIGSGGIYSVLDVIKAIALGANLVAVARPVIQKIHQGGESALYNYLAEMISDIAKACLLLGCSSPNELSSKHLIKA